MDNEARLLARTERFRVYYLPVNVFKRNVKKLLRTIFDIVTLGLFKGVF